MSTCEATFIYKNRPIIMSTFLGVNTYILAAVWANFWSWFYRLVWPSRLTKLVPAIAQEDTDVTNDSSDATRCVVIGRPGGLEQLRVIRLQKGVCTVGYNVPDQADMPFTKPIMHSSDVPAHCVVIAVHAFSVNYADCCIRWGLYESANKFVGFPMVPGFDICGRVEKVGTDVSHVAVGDSVLGCTLFGAYSTRVLVPANQVRQQPGSLTTLQAAAVPAVALTALYALHLAGHFPKPEHDSERVSNRAILVHSSAGGVGSMATQMAKILGCKPVVGVVGRSPKVFASKRLGCNTVIDKSKENLWEAAQKAAPNGYGTILDANGVSTLQASYDHLAMTGRLIVFGFHSNLPVGTDMLSPWQWFKMAIRMLRMPTIDVMDLTVRSKSVMGFNLSFFAQETEFVSTLLDQIITWLAKGRLQCPRVVDMRMEDVAQAHELIQSGKSIGKIVLTTDPLYASTNVISAPSTPEKTATRKLRSNAEDLRS